jgi:glyoxylase-like metal-dependent hydrolase (beta-lactamase superfamily II)
VDTPFKPSEAIAMRDRLAGIGPVRYVINTEPHIDHWTGNAYFDAPVVAHVGVRDRILGFDRAEHEKRIAALAPGEADHLPGYRVRAPDITFTDELTLQLGGQVIRLIHMPGHTPFQAAVVIENEGVVFTSDNLFNGVQTWLQEVNPEALFRALDRLRALDVEILVPGHGEVCDKSALDVQEAWVREWLDYVGRAVERGMTREEAADQLTGMAGRLPMDTELDHLETMVMRMNVLNLHDYLTGSGIHARG